MQEVTEKIWVVHFPINKKEGEIYPTFLYMIKQVIYISFIMRRKNIINFSIRP